jgi:hypothetical protein
MVSALHTWTQFTTTGDVLNLSLKIMKEKNNMIALMLPGHEVAFPHG